ncbi:MAG: hypothetical protein U0235_21510 [Polyangiaceae bacterium]
MLRLRDDVAERGIEAVRLLARNVRANARAIEAMIAGPRLGRADESAPDPGATRDVVDDERRDLGVGCALEEDAAACTWMKPTTPCGASSATKRAPSAAATSRANRARTSATSTG